MRNTFVRKIVDGIKNSMSIFYYKFKRPLNVSDQSEIDLNSGMLFSEKEEIAAGFKKDITPEGYRDQYILRTKVDPENKREDTIGEVEVIRRGGGTISSYEGGLEGSGGGFVETEAKSIRRAIDSETTLFVLSRPNALDGGKGIRVDAVIRYIRSV